ncbi:MAG: hypothetical protein ACFN0W_07700 [Propionibacterium acidifaciens]|uniref:hypothetical protein n=1 Tax=Propionibacterium acidifaciens TaxID=556499 RepID=UPI00360A1140
MSEPVRGSRVGLLVLVCWLGAVGAELLVLCGAFGAALVGAELEGAVSDGVALELEEVVLEGAALGVAVPEGVLVACWSADVLSSELALVEVLDGDVLGEAVQVGVLGVSEGADVSSGWEGVGHWHWHGCCSWHAGLAGPVAA